jgi:2-furoate---CoA ligase
MLEFAADRYPEKTAIIDGGRRFAYGDWNARVNRVANALRDLGLGHGDHVVQVLKNCEENCAIHMACQKIGAINTPVNFRWSSGEVEYCVNDADARLVVYEEATRAVVEPALDRLRSSARRLWVGGGEAGSDVVRFDEIVDSAPANAPEAAVHETDAALMLYTSGTTGRPKGVPRSQSAEYAATIGQIVQHRYVSGERTLGVMPLYHTMGQHSLTAMVALNGCFVVMADWSARGAAALIERERVTSLYLVPTLYHDLVNEPSLGDFDLSSVCKISYAGAPMLGTLVDRCGAVFNPDVFINHYGSTEVYTFRSIRNRGGSQAAQGAPHSTPHCG